ncbi:nodulation protein NodN [Sphingomonas sp. Root710]|uniref:MaoC family dehydratase n=1 Tax=Sphingomonas sp. Root710 TaxID=1736594 RepID=UPI0006F56C12|nr:MaoC family dehydratase [Sphingomonas sp. Root710]KRB86743.1 nodulation protein NodN [Sphingomonas sp. Root710]
MADRFDVPKGGLSATLEYASARYSEWLLVDQTMIDRFADLTLDRQYIHVDPVRAAETPFGGTVAHGFLTLALLTHLFENTQGAIAPGVQMLVNYGFDRVRFIHPIRAGARIRGAFTLIDLVEKRPGQFQQTHEVVIQVEGLSKPAMVANWVTQYLQ